MSRRVLLSMMLAAASVAETESAAITVTHAAADAIVTSASITIAGTVDVPETPVNVAIHGAVHPATMAGNTWTFDNAGLEIGLNVVVIQATGQSDVTLFLTRVEALAPRPEQK